MKRQFDVWHYHFEEKGGDHPCVLISHPELVARAKFVNILFCTSQRQSRQPYPSEVLLDQADGLDWETFCECSLIFAVKSAELFRHRGHVSLERRNAIRDRLRDMFRLSARD